MPRPARTAHTPTESSDGGSPTALKRAARAHNRMNAPDLSKDSKRERTKDGCLTCRMRRKKCETDLTPDGSCTTCHRLRIECYGFGAKRPDWMKDKSLVEAKLQEIKEHLVREGLVRGVAKDKSAKKPAATTRAGTSASPPPPPPRPASPVVVPSRTSPSSPRKPSAISTRPDASILIPPIAPLSHPAPERNNPQYLPSRAASRSPVLVPATPRVPVIPPPLQTSSRAQQSVDSDSSDETSPQTPPGSYASLSVPSQGASSSSGMNTAHISEWPSDMLSADPQGSDLLHYRLSASYLEPYAMDPSSSSMSSLVPLAPVPQHPGALSNIVSYSEIDPTSEAYYQDMENTFGLVLQRGVQPAIAGQMVTQSWQAPYDTPWASFIPSPRIRSLTPMPSYMRPQEDGFMYYFDHVATMQYIFDSTSTDTMHAHIRSNPTGVVATAIKMIAAVHDSQNRKASGLDPGGLLRTSGTPEHLYRETYSQIMATLKRSNGKLTEADATAALHMISYWLFQGGDGQWAEALKIAVHWFQNVEDLYTKKGPQVIRNMTAEQRFAAKTTMWMDIFSSITQLRIPYLNGLYDHLLKSSPGTSDFFGTTNGCCDAVMCSLASIVTLEFEIKSSETLVTMDDSTRQTEFAIYVYRASKIKEQLRQIDCSPPRFTEVAASFLVEDTFPSPPDSNFATSDIFRHAALIYLSTIINGPSPSVPETCSAVAATYSAFLNLPASEIDRSLVFPLCFAGCMTDDPALRRYFGDRLKAMDGPVGNCGKAMLLMEAVWSRRDNLGLVMSWRDVMRETQLELLLV